MDQGNQSARQLLRSLSPRAFLAFGVNQLAYIKLVTIEGHSAYALHAADGTPLSLIDSFEGALSVAEQNDLDPVLLH